VGRLRQLGRLVIVVALSPFMLALVAAPAAAHGGGPDATYYVTKLTGITPSLPNVSARVDPAGEWIELTYTGPGEVIMLGYMGEPYLRITVTNVEENELSQTTYLNKAMFAEIPTGAQPSNVPPSWRPVATTGSARWHDHRIHWMGGPRPPDVAADPRHPHTFASWAIHAINGGTRFQIRGNLGWRGKPPSLSPTVWLVVILVNVPFLVMVLILKRPHRNQPIKSSVADYAAEPVPNGRMSDDHTKPSHAAVPGFRER
jgi:hypothetical protein